MVFTENHIEKLHSYAVEVLKPKRLRHVLGSAEYICELATVFGYPDVCKARVAALAHDLCRDWSDERLLGFCRHEVIAPWEREKPLLLHGRAASLLLKREFDIVDDELHSALVRHTLGDADMSALDSLLYIADYAEPNRSHVDDAHRTAISCSTSLSKALRIVYDHHIGYYDQGALLPPVTAMGRWLLEKAQAE